MPAGSNGNEGNSDFDYQVDSVNVHVYVPGQVELGGSDDRGDEALADVCAAGGGHVHPAPAPVVPAQAAG